MISPILWLSNAKFKPIKMVAVGSSRLEFRSVPRTHAHGLSFLTPLKYEQIQQAEKVPNLLRFYTGL
jgi:hypothetical protein